MSTSLSAPSPSPEVGETAASAIITPLQVRGRSFTAVVLRLTGPADKSFYDSLEALMRQAPHFFINAPLVVDLAEAPDFLDKADFVKLARQLRARKLAVIGIQNGTPEQGVAAFAAGLTTLQGGRDANLERTVRPAAFAAEKARAEAAAEAAKAEAAAEAARPGAAAEAARAEAATAATADPAKDGAATDEPAKPAAPHPEAARPADASDAATPDAAQTDAAQADAAQTDAAKPGAGSTAASVIVTEPVRSGQRIYADRGDLVVMAPVSSGAELIAHGNIHVYGPLRGRALAGVNGDKTARIFCQSLEAELVAIAGLYRTSDDMPADLRNKRAQAFLQDDTLKIEPLK